MLSKKGKIVLITSNYAWTVYNFRLSLIRRLKTEGYKVIVLTQFDGYESHIAKEVDQVINLCISRMGVNPFFDILTVLDYLRKFIIIKPDIVLSFSIKPVIYSNIAAKLLNIKSIVMITGLGTSFIGGSIIKHIVTKLYRFALRSVSIVIFQNQDDKNLFLTNNIVNKDKCLISPGSGVDTDKFSYSNLPNSKVKNFLFVGRIISDKGINEFINAAREIKKEYSNVNFQIVGPLNVENRTSISRSEVEEWQKEGVIEYLGETDNVLKYIRMASCVVLPSYREGTSKALLEAAAVGRPLIASNVPGCKEIIDDGINGYLCKPKDYVSLIKKIELMLMLTHIDRVNMGIKGHEKVERNFKQEIVSDIYSNAISEVLFNKENT